MDTQLLFDTASWLGSTESTDGDAGKVNRVLADRLGTLFAAGETEDAGTVGQSVVDASEIVNTLGDTEYATLGYAAQELDPTSESRDDSILTRLQNVFGGTDDEADVDDVTARKAIETRLRRAVRAKLTAECARPAVERGLIVFAGPPAWVHRDAIADGRSWLATECQSSEIQSGDVPAPERTSLAVLVLLSDVDEIPRLEELR